ncbi:hypothetical protein Tco_0896334, partial [Tanacetum coccineum]
MYRTSSDRQRVLSSDKKNMKLKHADCKLQQWFRKGLAVKKNVGFLLYEHSRMPDDQIQQLVVETLASIGLK